MKLPQEFDPKAISDLTYKYLDALEMVQDMRRLRRRTGWSAYGNVNKDSYLFYVVGSDADPEPEPFVCFEILTKVVHRDFWPSRYPGEPDVEKLRRWFLTKGGVDRVAGYVNEVSRIEDTSGPSVLDRLLDDEDLL